MSDGFEEQEEESIYDDNTRGTAPDDKSVIEKLFNTEKRIELLYHDWRGEIQVKTSKGLVWRKMNKELAGDRFINKQMSAMRSIVNVTNSFTRKTDIECSDILFRAVEAFIKDMVNDSTVLKKDYRTLAKSYEHALQLFLGLVEFGHGSKVLRDTMAGLNTGTETEKKGKSISDWLKGNL